MDKIHFLLTTLVWTCLVLSACGIPETQWDAPATQIAIGISTNQTQIQTVTPTQPPTATLRPQRTPTITPQSSQTRTITREPQPTRTPEPTAMHEWNLSRVALTLNDLPDGFEAMDAQEQRALEQQLPEGSAFFSFLNLKHQNVMGVLVPVTEAHDQIVFDMDMPTQCQNLSTDINAEEFSRMQSLDDIGDVRTGITGTGQIMSLAVRDEIVCFRRGSVGVFLVVVYPAQDTPVLDICALARLLDQRIKQQFIIRPEDL